MFKLEATTVSIGRLLVKTGLDGGQTPKPEAGLEKNSPRILLSLDKENIGVLSFLFV